MKVAIVGGRRVTEQICTIYWCLLRTLTCTPRVLRQFKVSKSQKLVLTQSPSIKQGKILLQEECKVMEEERYYYRRSAK